MTRGLAALARGRRSAVADIVLFRALRDRLGFSRLRSAATGGAALGPDTFAFFRALGVPLRQLYGQTELIGAYTLHRDGEVDSDTVGVAFDHSIEMRIEAPDQNGVGEVVTRHPNMFLGYYKKPDETQASLRDGWMLTGDAGYFNDQPASSSSSTASGPGGDRARHALLAAIHREQAQVLPLCRRGGDPGSGPPLRWRP